MPTIWIGSFGVFNPLDLSPVFWIDASDPSTITSSSGKVSQWNDKSGNGYHVTQSTSTQQPNNDTQTLNGRTVIDFDGGDFLQNLSGSIIGKNVTGLTIYALVKYDTLSTGERVVFKANAGSFARVQLYCSSVSGVLRVGGRTLDADSLAFASSSSKSTIKWYTQVGVFDYANTDLNQYIDGTIDGQNTSFQFSTTTSNTNSPYLYIGSNEGGSGFLDGQIAEIIVYHSAHDATTRTKVLNYFASKWGV